MFFCITLPPRKYQRKKQKFQLPFKEEKKLIKNEQRKIKNNKHMI